MNVVRAALVTLLALVLALVIAGALGGGVGVLGLVVLVCLAVLGFGLWLRRSRSNV